MDIDMVTDMHMNTPTDMETLYFFNFLKKCNNLKILYHMLALQMSPKVVA